LPSVYSFSNFKDGGGVDLSARLKHACTSSSGASVVTFDNLNTDKEINFGFWKEFSGWWQAVGGDVYGGGGLSSLVPESVVPITNQRLILQNTNLFDGLAWHSGGNIDIGLSSDAKISESGWNVSSDFDAGPYTYEYFKAKTGVYPSRAWNGNSALNGNKPTYDPPAGYDYRIYTFGTGAETAKIKFDIGSSQKMIFLVDGNVEVEDRAGAGGKVINVAEGGFLAVIASGKITFKNGITQAEGIYIADNLEVESTGDTATEVQFAGEGTFVGWNGIALNRNLGVDNNTTPAEKFIFRPDFVINAPDALKQTRYVWREVAP